MTSEDAPSRKEIWKALLAGYRARRRGETREQAPDAGKTWHDFHLREAWRAGWSVGDVLEGTIR